MRIDFAARHTLLLQLLCCLFLCASCDDKRRHSAAKGVDISPTSRPISRDTPPEKVALEVVKALSDAQIARAHGMGRPEAKRDYDSALARVWGLIDAPTIHQYVSQSASMTLPKNMTERAAVTAVVESWMSILAHYAGGIVEESLAQRFLDPKGSAIIYLEVVNPNDRRSLQELVAAIATTGDPAVTSRPALRPEDEAEIRRRALARGIVPALAAGITVTLTKSGDLWLATRIAVGPPQAARSPAMETRQKALEMAQPQTQPTK